MFALLAAAALAGPPAIDAPLRTGASRPDDAALVVGIENYPFLPDVRFAHRDADAMHRTLVHTVGVPPERVALLKGGSREQIVGAVRRAAGQVGPEGTLWVYFAGHGANGPDGLPMLVADDARADLEVFAARSIPITALAHDLGVQTNLIVDACWTGLSRDGEALVPGSRFVVPTWSIPAIDQVRVWTATSANQVAGPYPAAQQGLFTYFVAGALRGWADGELDGRRDGTVTAGEAHAYVTRMFAAVQVHGQTPWWDGPGDLVLSTGRGLERAPSTDRLPPAVAEEAPPKLHAAIAARPERRAPPAYRYVGDDLYRDVNGRAISYNALQGRFSAYADVQRVDRRIRRARHTRNAGLITMGTGLLVSGIAALAHDGAVKDYRWDLDRHVQDQARCDRDSFWCGSVGLEPSAPRPIGVAVGAGITTAGATVVLGGAFDIHGQRRRLARLASRRADP